MIVLAIASTTSGAPANWAAGPERPGVSLTHGWSTDVVGPVASRVAALRRPGDVVVASIHWGSNWGHDVPAGQRRLAHALIDAAGVDVVHGHSSHHVRPIERYQGRLILYGCGDFITDYEGITGNKEYRGDLALAYFATVDPATGETAALSMAPFRLRRFQLTRPSEGDIDWLARTLARDSGEFGVRVELGRDGSLAAT